MGLYNQTTEENLLQKDKQSAPK